MPGRDITRLQNRAARVLLFTLLILAGVLTAMPVWSQSAAPQNDAKPSTAPSSTQSSPAPSSPSQSSSTPASPAQSPAQSSSPPAPATPGQTQPKKDEQDQKLNDQGVFVFRQDVNEVLLHASVVDDKQRIVTNLTRDDFTVLEDGKPQKIISFRHEDIPVSMGILIDNSGSMREKRNKVNQAALNLVRSSNPQDEVFIVNFNDEYYLDQDITNNLLKLKEALEKIDARGGTALYDALGEEIPDPTERSRFRPALPRSQGYRTSDRRRAARPVSRMRRPSLAATRIRLRVRRRRARSNRASVTGQSL